MYLPTIGPLFGGPTSQQEAELAAVVLAWVRANLDEVIDVQADAARLGLAGHSRGGKVVWQVLSADPSGVMAVAGIEPTDGMGILFGMEPRAITGPFDFPFPSFVLGAGRGRFCSPDGDNHVQYFQASAPPAWHVVAPNMGHTDMLDEGEADIASAVCPAGEDRPGARMLTAGLLTAFFRATLQGDESAFAVLTDTARAPIEIVVDLK
jgi:chlorophyllase